MASKKPNILVLFTDMQRGDTVHSLGNSIIKTPNLDRLVAEGTAFTNCQTTSPTCLPARCSMFHGIYPNKWGFYDTNMNMPEEVEKSWPALLGENGYNTHSIGKTHFQYGDMHGFKTREQQEENCSDPEKDDYVAWLEENNMDTYEPQGMRSEMYYIPQISVYSQDAHPTNWIGDKSVDFIKKSKSDSEPWALFSSYIHPHPPMAPPKPWHRLYRAPLMPLPVVPDQPESYHTWSNKGCNRYKYRDQGIDNNLIRTIKAYYYACISFVDFQIGKILAALEETGQLDNTLIIFTSDHGEYLGDYNCFGKRSMNDAATRVPLIVRYPEKFKAGKRCEEPASLVDLMPTIANVSGLDLVDIEQDGEDLADIADEKSNRKAVYGQFGANQHGMYMHVEKDWKYFYSAGDDREYLFNRRTDPNETNNIAGVKFVEKEKNRIKRNLLVYLKENGLEKVCEETEKGLDFKKFPPIDMSRLDDPNHGLLVSEPDIDISIPGYTD